MYRAPIADQRFLLEFVLNSGQLAHLPRFPDYSAELAESVLNEAGRFAGEVLAPLNQSGDRAGAKWGNSGVRSPPGFKLAYQQYVEGGWPQLAIAAEHGGQGAPSVLGTAIEEIWCGANMAFMLCPLLSHGAIEALVMAGTSFLKETYLPKMVTGEWSGTMNLTEPQAGSDLAAIRTRAALSGNHYRVVGQKIFITYGDQDMTENIVHLVLARIDGAPAGVKGLSLFVVPKFIPNSDGTLGQANDLRCVSIEHKLGIHASPTCVMAYGDNGGAEAWLVGEPGRGLEYMFVMMNAARLSVGVQGIGLAENAFQQALAWSRNRVQGRVAGVRSDAAVAIIQHADVRRLLLTLRSGVEAMRALALYAALQLDLARALPDQAARVAALARGELLIPIVKGWSTEFGAELVSMAVQVHGGMGYIEETGIAQVLRDVRITSIYEGTTAIQANDLLGRKLRLDGGAALRALLDEAERELAGYAAPATAAASAQSTGLEETLGAAREALAVLRGASVSLTAQLQTAADSAFGVSVPYLRLCGVVLGGWLLARAAHIAATQLAANGGDRNFLIGKLQSARFYAAQTLPQALALARVVCQGGASVASVNVDLI